MTPEVHKAALDQEWDEKWRRPAPKPTRGMGNFVNMVESVIGTDGHENKAPGQIFKEAIDAQETITAPLKRRMRIHTADLSKKQKGKLQAKLDENTILFKKPKQYSQLNLHHKLTLHHKGAFAQNAYRYDKEKTKFIDDAVAQLLRDPRDETIQLSTGPWAAPVVVAKKKEGQLRFCVNYRRLNTQTVVDVFSMPDVKKTLDALAHAKYFSVMNARVGY